MKNFIFISLFTWSLVAACHANDDWETHPEWSGSWRTGPDVAKLLGFEAREDVSTFPSTLQIEFCASRDAAFQVLGKPSVEFAQSRIEEMGHKILAAGRYKTHTTGDTSSMCFVTKKQGGTYLWLGDQSQSMTFAKVHYNRGVTPKHDLLILDLLGVFPERLRGKKYIDASRPTGYRRQKE